MGVLQKLSRGRGDGYGGVARTYLVAAARIEERETLGRSAGAYIEGARASGSATVAMACV